MMSPEVKGNRVLFDKPSYRYVCKLGKVQLEARMSRINFSISAN